MPKVTLNRMKWKAELCKQVPGLDNNDRPAIIHEKIRDIFYVELGITSQEKYLSQQAKTDVVRRIKVRLDKSITEKFSAVRIDSVTYKITRIYTNMDKREMELSLAYVD